MIGMLTGRLVTKRPPLLILDVAGVGYEVEAPMSTFYNLPETGTATTLYTHCVVRADAQLLYGFGTEAEKALFRELLKVSSVGPKVALAVLSGVSVDEFRIAVQSGDAARLRRTPGIGKKTSERIVMELRDRFAADAGAAAAGIAAGFGIARNEARAALESLGYKPVEAERLVAAVYEEGMATDAVIRAALKQAMR